MREVRPTWQEVLDNCRAFARKVGKGDYYIWALRVIAQAWGKCEQDNIDIRGIVGGIMILEYSWNDIFYEDELFDQRRLEKCIQEHLALISELRKCDLTSTDAVKLRQVQPVLFSDFLDALGKRKSGVRGPVAVGKCLHLMSPRLFPLWDTKIAEATGHHWGRPVSTVVAADCYGRFMQFTKELIEHVVGNFAEDLGVPLAKAKDGFFGKYKDMIGQEARLKTMLKLMDEYLYVEYTRPEWKGDA